MTVSEGETKFGKHWKEWSQREWDEVLKTTEVDDLKYPLIVIKVMEAYTAGRGTVLTDSVKAFIAEAR
jgi:hypothetical protein